MKVVINQCFGGFGLSTEAKELYAQKVNKPLYTDVSSDLGGFMFSYWCTKEEFNKMTNEERAECHFWEKRDLKRTDPSLIEVVEELGERANDQFSRLSIVNIPDNVDWIITEYNGYERIEEKHRS